VLTVPPKISDETEIATVHAAGSDDVDIAVKAARNAFKDPSWRDIETSARGGLLNKLAALVEEHAEILATIETWDNGKPYSVALGVDVSSVVDVFRYYGGWADKLHGQVFDTTPDKFAYTVREPVGVCGQIIP
jgi:aldehyde dehydrogenase (NAD+)